MAPGVGTAHVIRHVLGLIHPSFFFTAIELACDMIIILILGIGPDHRRAMVDPCRSVDSCISRSIPGSQLCCCQEDGTFYVDGSDVPLKGAGLLYRISALAVGAMGGRCCAVSSLGSLSHGLGEALVIMGDVGTELTMATTPTR